MAKKRIVVLGGGISGYGSAILAKKCGHDVFLSDAGAISEIYRQRLEQWDVEYEQGGHSMDKILNATEVIKSPGIPDKAPVVVAIRERG
ncbi:MAG: UDP-N-acetylmuramoyl-L-alanine--D-glutamate ligase, partial [Alistipes sp.]|nr:UDP-N-acetylmuramoyl-L-alanine--D-glutamate ligase [Alistipes sp.]